MMAPVSLPLSLYRCALSIHFTSVFRFVSLSLSIHLSVHPSVCLCISLSGWIPRIQMYIQRHTNGRERERKRQREACRSILCAATTRSHPSPRRAATMNPWIDCSLFTLEHSHIMAGPPLDVVDYPLSSKLNLSDCSPAVRMISHRSCSIVFFFSLFLLFFSIGDNRGRGWPFVFGARGQGRIYLRKSDRIYFLFFFLPLVLGRRSKDVLI